MTPWRGAIFIAAIGTMGLLGACDSSEDPAPDGPTQQDGTRFFVEDLGAAELDTPYTGRDPWPALEWSLDELDQVERADGAIVALTPVPLDLDEQGRPSLAEWRGTDGQGHLAKVLPARRALPFHEMAGFQGLPRPPDPLGFRRVMVRQDGDRSIQVERTGYDTDVWISLEIPVGGLNVPDGADPPMVSLHVEGEEVARLVPRSPREQLIVQLDPASGAQEWTLRFEGVAGTAGLLMRHLGLTDPQGVDRIVVSAGARSLVAATRPPAPVQRLRSRKDAPSPELTRAVLLDHGPLTIVTGVPWKYEIEIDGERVARTEGGGTRELDFDNDAPRTARLTLRSLAGPWRCDVLLLQPHAGHRRPSERLRGQDAEPRLDPLVHHFTRNDVSRRSLLLMAGSRFSVPVEGRPGDRIAFAAAAEDTRGNMGGADPVERLRVRVTVEQDGAEQELTRVDVDNRTPWLEEDLELPVTGAAKLHFMVESAGNSVAQDRMLRLALGDPCLLRTPSSRRPNLILYLADTLRADRLGCYGHERDTSPSIDALAADGILFQNAHSQASWTKPSVATLFTGLLQSFHGAGKDSALPADVTTLAEHARAMGYETAAFVANPYVHVRGLNFEQGFSRFVAIITPGRSPIAADVHAAALPWMESRGDRPYFVVIHTIDPHETYDPPAEVAGTWSSGYTGSVKPADTFTRELKRRELDDADLQYLLDLYDEEILGMDREIGRLVQRLKDGGRYEDAVILFVSDHGEQFLDHGGWGHGTHLWGELLNVPMILKLAGADRPRGVKVSERVPTTCVLPTLCAALGWPVPDDEVQGIDLTSFWSGEAETLDCIAEHEPGLRTLIRGPAKIIQDTTGGTEVLSLYDLEKDAGEHVDLAAQFPDRAEALRNRLLGVLERDRQNGLGSQTGSVDVVLTEDQRAQLRALGYLDD